MNAPTRVTNASADGESPSQQWRGFKPFRIVGLRDESVAIRSLYLSPLDGMPLPRHRAGQYVAVRLPNRDVGKAMTRTYSISSGPGDPETLRISIKREEGALNGALPPGIFSNYIHDHLRIGDILEVRPPLGEFHLDLAGGAPVVLVSAGVGITPMIAILEALMAEPQRRPVLFLHGARSGRHQGFRMLLRRAAELNPELTTHVRFSRPEREDILRMRHDSVGRIDLQLLSSFEVASDAHYFLCGPLGFLRDLYRGLSAAGVPPARIHYEHFGVPVNLAAEEHTAGAAKPAKPKRIAGDEPDRAPTVTFEQSGVLARWEGGAGSILELAERAGLHPAYSCRSGVCQTCACRLLRGAVEYFVDPAIDPPEGMVLICCSRPKGDVTIEL